MASRITLKTLGAIVASCGAALYVLFAAVGQNARTSSASHLGMVEEPRQFSPSRVESGAGPRWGEEENPNEGFEEALNPNLDSWYAEAGAASGPLDVSPEDKSYLINEAEPTSDGEPFF